MREAALANLVYFEIEYWKKYSKELKEEQAGKEEEEKILPKWLIERTAECSDRMFCFHLYLLTGNGVQWELDSWELLKEVFLSLLMTYIMKSIFKLLKYFPERADLVGSEEREGNDNTSKSSTSLILFATLLSPIPKSLGIELANASTTHIRDI